MTQTVLLALDTSTEFCSVALLSVSVGAAAETSAEPRVWVRHEQTGAVSSTRLLPAIRELFAEAGLALADCDAIAFGSGPGSFTGLRTATGVAQGLAFGLNLPVVPISTLLACAESARLRDPSATRVLAALDARMDEVYWADFAWDAAQDEWRTVHPASLDAPGRLVLPDDPFTLAGNAAAAFGARLPALDAARTVDAEALPHALPLAHAALRALRAGRTVPADQAAPEYIRDKVAQTTAERMAEKAAKLGTAEHAGGLAGVGGVAGVAGVAKGRGAARATAAAPTIDTYEAAKAAEAGKAAAAAKATETTEAVKATEVAQHAKAARAAPQTASPTSAPRAPDEAPHDGSARASGDASHGASHDEGRQ